jgi:DNA-binding MarR family transcriptional regulator
MKTVKRTKESTKDNLRLDLQVCFPLYAATNLLQRLYRPLLDPLGLTYSQYLVMLVLWEREQVSVGELRDCLHLDLGTLSPLLKRMEKAGHITRQRDASDERRVLVKPSQHGHSLYKAAQSIPAALADQIGITQREVENLRDEARSLIVRLTSATAANILRK